MSSDAALASRWPDFFIVGAPKAGTTTLFSALRGSPHLCMPMKEPRFFARQIAHDAFFSESVTDESHYTALFESCGPHRLAGEASPTYLMDPSVPAAIASRVPDAKIVIVIRDPVERAYSHFLFRERRTARRERSFAEAIEQSFRSMSLANYDESYLIPGGMYSEAITRYLNQFGPTDVLTLVFEEVISDLLAAVNEVARFLGVPPMGGIDISEREHNPAAMPRGRVAGRLLQSSTLRRAASTLLPNRAALRIGIALLTVPAAKPPMKDADRFSLQDIYRHDVRATEAVLGRELPWEWARDQSEDGR